MSNNQNNRNNQLICCVSLGYLRVNTNQRILNYRSLWIFLVRIYKTAYSYYQNKLDQKLPFSNLIKQLLFDEINYYKEQRNKYNKVSKNYKFSIGK